MEKFISKCGEKLLDGARFGGVGNFTFVSPSLFRLYGFFLLSFISHGGALRSIYGSALRVVLEKQNERRYILEIYKKKL